MVTIMNQVGFFSFHNISTFTISKSSVKYVINTSIIKIDFVSTQTCFLIIHIVRCYTHMRVEQCNFGVVIDKLNFRQLTNHVKAKQCLSKL